MHLKMLISILKSICAVSERKSSLKVLVICTRSWEADVLCGKSNLCILLWTHTCPILGTCLGTWEILLKGFSPHLQALRARDEHLRKTSGILSITTHITKTSS